MSEGYLAGQPGTERGYIVVENKQYAIGGEQGPAGGLTLVYIWYVLTRPAQPRVTPLQVMLAWSA